MSEDVTTVAYLGVKSLLVIIYLCYCPPEAAEFPMPSFSQKKYNFSTTDDIYSCGAAHINVSFLKWRKSKICSKAVQKHQQSIYFLRENFNKHNKTDLHIKIILKLSFLLEYSVIKTVVYDVKQILELPPFWNCKPNYPYSFWLRSFRVDASKRMICRFVYGFARRFPCLNTGKSNTCWRCNAASENTTNDANVCKWTELHNAPLAAIIQIRK